jgi:molybdopterin synthase catalytic subunit
MPLELAVKLFASVREELGCDSVAVSLEVGGAVDDLLEILYTSYPEIAARRGGLKVAVNHEVARGGRVLSKDDEIALIPPVGGG